MANNESFDIILFRNANFGVDFGAPRRAVQNFTLVSRQDTPMNKLIQIGKAESLLLRAAFA